MQEDHSSTVKGTKPEGGDKCDKCSASGRDCIQGLSWNFRQVTSVSSRKDKAQSRHGDFHFDETQQWVDLPSTSKSYRADTGRLTDRFDAPVRFIAPNTDLETLTDLEDVEDTQEAPEAEESQLVTAGLGSPDETSTLVECRPDGADLTPQAPDSQITAHTTIIPEYNADSLNDCQDLVGGDVAALQELLDAHQRQHVTLHDDNISLAFSDSPNYGHDYWTRSGQFPFTPASSPLWHMSNAYEARLFHHYIVHLSPWVPSSLT